MNGFYNLAIMQAIHNLGNAYLYDAVALEDLRMFVDALEQYGEAGEA